LSRRSLRSKARRSSPTPINFFRTWKLGEKQKNNGVLLLVAPNEHRVRIEVGYGLEGTLTDALSKVIVANAIAPRFKAGDFAGGIARGVDDIITVLTTDASEWQEAAVVAHRCPGDADPVNYILIFGLIGLVILLIVSPASVGSLQHLGEYRALIGRVGKRLVGGGGFFRRRRIVGRGRGVGER